jgi:hypothetical protein
MNAQSSTLAAKNPPLRLSDPAAYQICLQGCLDDHWASWFDGMVLTRDEALNTTTLVGTVPDQAALHGLLIRVRDMGLPLLSVLRTE